MRVSDFDFDLPQELIALRPAVPREAARLLIVHEGSPEFGEATLRDLPGLLNPGDLCVYNDTKVINAQLFGTRKRTGGDLRSSVVFSAIDTVRIRRNRIHTSTFP